MIEISVHHYFHFLPEHQEDVLKVIRAQLDRIEQNMTNQYDNLQASIAATNSSLEEIASDLQAQADKIQELMDQIAGGLTAEQAEAVNTELAAIRDRSAQLAAVVNPDVPPGDVPTA